MTTTTTDRKMINDNDSLDQTARGAMGALRLMVDALNCDYDRLEELRSERGNLQDEVDAIAKSADIDDDAQATIDALAEWDVEYAAELAELESAANGTGNECASRDDAEQQIHEDPLSLELRTGWYTPGRDADTAPAQFRLLLTTGGPAVQIIGDLDEHGQPSNPRLEVQDWGTPWTVAWLTAEDKAALQTYCEQFCFEV